MTTTTIIDPAKDTGLVSAKNNTNYNISSDGFEGVIAKLPEDQQDVLRFWFFLGKDQDYSLSKLANVCGVSSTTLSRIFRGEYGAELTNVCATLAKARASLTENVGNPEYKHTSLAKQMFSIFDRTRALRTISFMEGDMGIGKTTVELEYKRLNNHGRTTYYRCEPGLTFVQFVTEVARANGVSYQKQTHLRLREKLYRVFGAGNRLFIVDEFHQLFLKRSRGDTSTPVMQCEFLRAMYDIAGGGISIVSTDAIEQHLQDNKAALAQLLDRGTIYAKLPKKPTKGDIKMFLDDFSLSDPTGRNVEASSILADIIKESGLRKLTLHLRDGAAYAKKTGQRYDWNHFVTAFKDIKAITR